MMTATTEAFTLTTAKLEAVTSLTMTSREIAELTGKEHFNVLIDIRKMLAELGEDELKFQAIYFDSMNRKQTEYLLDRELTDTLLTGYSAIARRKVIARWHELEARAAAPAAPTTASMFFQSAQVMLEMESRTTALEKRQITIAARLDEVVEQNVLKVCPQNAESISVGRPRGAAAAPLAQTSAPMNPTKGDGPGAANDRPAKKYTNNATNFIAACARMASVRAAFHAQTQASTSSTALMFLSQGCSKPDVSDVSGVQAFIHAGFSRYGTDTADVSDVSARGYRRRKWRTTKAQFGDNGAALNPSRRCRAVERALLGRHLKRPVRVAGALQAGRCADIWRTRTCVLGCCDRVQAGAEKHHGLGGPERSAIAARPSLDSGFSISYPVLRGAHGTFYGGPCGGIRKSAPVLRPVRQPHTVCHPYLAVRGQFLNCHVGANMADNRISTPKKGILTLGTTPPTSPVSIARRIAIEAALSLALFHVRRDNPQAAVGRAIRAASMLKQACAEATTTHAGRV